MERRKEKRKGKKKGKVTLQMRSGELVGFWVSFEITQSQIGFCYFTYSATRAIFLAQIAKKYPKEASYLFPTLSCHFYPKQHQISWRREKDQGWPKKEKEERNKERKNFGLLRAWKIENQEEEKLENT